MPLIFFQDLDDPVVPPAQSERMACALAASGVPVMLESLPDERHGFRHPDTIARVPAAELACYRYVLNPDSPEPESVPVLDWFADSAPSRNTR